MVVVTGTGAMGPGLALSYPIENEASVNRVIITLTVQHHKTISIFSFRQFTMMSTQRADSGRADLFQCSNNL
jgi:hypothetical protein